MEYRVYKTTTKKRGDQYHLHTASCPAGARLRKRTKDGRFVKLVVGPAQYVEDVAEGFNKVYKHMPVVHSKCCKLFKKPNTKNPECPHCGNSSTVFASNIGMGKKEFTCSKCKKLFVIVKPKKETVMKIKIQKKQQKAETKKMSKAARQADRIQKREARKAAREQRKAERQAKRDERAKAREARQAERKAKRAARISDRMNKMFETLMKLSDKDLSNLAKAFAKAMPPSKAKKSKAASKKKKATKK